MGPEGALLHPSLDLSSLGLAPWDTLSSAWRLSDSRAGGTSCSCLLSHQPSIFSWFLQHCPVCSAPQVPRAFRGYVPRVHLSHLRSPSPATHSCLQGTFWFRFHGIQILRVCLARTLVCSPVLLRSQEWLGRGGAGEGTPWKSQGSHLVTDSPTDLCSVPQVLSQVP